MLKLSDPVSPIPSEFQVSESRCRAVAEEFLQRACYDAAVDAAEDRREVALRFLGEANRLVDTISSSTFSHTVEIPRFVRVAPVRFGRIRLFLSKFIGRAAWRRGVSL